MSGLRVCTTNLSAGQTLRVVASMNVVKLSYKMSTGTSDAGSVTGNATIKDVDGNDIVSSAVALGPGDGDVFISGPVQPLDGLTLSCTTGTLRIFMAQG